MKSAKILVLSAIFIFTIYSADAFNARILGGFETAIEGMPWQVSLIWYSYFRCGGSIIGQNWVISAAHCTSGSSSDLFGVRVGSSMQTGGKLVKIKRIINHEQYKFPDYDFSLLELVEPLIFTASVQPIALPSGDLRIKDGTLLLISGWGRTHIGGTPTEKIRASYVPMVSQNECIQLYGPFITDRMICAGYKDGGVGVCQGDSGGPLSLRINDVPVLIGLSSFVFECGSPKVSSIFSRVTSVRPWIKYNTGISDGFNARIFGGLKATIERMPWQVALIRHSYFRCGGSIIGQSWVISAAHCTNGTPADAFGVRVGTSLRYSGKLIGVKRIINHEKFNMIFPDFDFTLLELAEPLTFSESIQPIALADADLKIEDGTMCLISGWGKSENSTESREPLRSVYVPTVSQSDCVRRYGPLITNRMICAGNKEGGVGVCNGDSGGPLSTEINDVPVLIGCASFVVECGSPKVSSIFSRIAAVRPWIKSNTGI
ncbi:trypsin-3-like [Contarinia nasturtii]|uniref:trypsin-3-like n=1 Tax=Contarinia nasturtii TaxID=265458 RepID=UPI0012D4A2C6|nr:trypsin-3-like [Contarinia nasturtii]